MPGRIGLPEALPKKTACSGYIFSGAPASAPIMLNLLYPRANSIRIPHWFLGVVCPQRPLPLSLQAHSCSLFPFEEQAPLRHGQPEGDKESHAHNPKCDGIDVEVVHS